MGVCIRTSLCVEQESTHTCVCILSAGRMQRAALGTHGGQGRGGDQTGQAGQPGNRAARRHLPCQVQICTIKMHQLAKHPDLHFFLSLESYMNICYKTV